MSERNIAALMRNDCRTVHVRFNLVGNEFDAPPYPPTGKKPTNGYTYVTDIALSPCDIVVVDGAGELKLAWVESVDDDVKIEPSSETTFEWVRAPLAYVQSTGVGLAVAAFFGLAYLTIWALGGLSVPRVSANPGR